MVHDKRAIVGTMSIQPRLTDPLDESTTSATGVEVMQMGDLQHQIRLMQRPAVRRCEVSPFMLAIGLLVVFTITVCIIVVPELVLHHTEQPSPPSSPPQAPPLAPLAASPPNMSDALTGGS